MKKILLLANFGWILILAVCLTKCTNDGPGTVALSGPCVDVTGMDGATFLRGLARYKNYQLSAINDRLRGVVNANFEDARSCWYSIDTLKRFICLIEKYAKSNGLDPATSDLGIRFYYATYADTVHQIVPTGILGNLTAADVGMHHTLFMVPTHHKKESDIDLILPMDGRINSDTRANLNLKSLEFPDWEAYIKTPQTKLLILGQSTITSASSKNQGQLCPPTCPTDAASTLTKADALTDVTVH